MIDVVLPNEYFDTYMYIERTKEIINKLKLSGKIPIIVGGTYLYIQALLYGLPETSEPDFKLRKKLESIVQKKGLDFLYKKLKTVDKVYAEKIGRNDKKRIIRALEVFINTGKPFSTFHKWQEPKMKVLGFYTNLTQEELNENIEKRTYHMIEQGLEVECINLLCLGYKEAMTSSQAIGYKEMIPYIEGKASLKEAVENIIKNTKEYASRQRRWFQKTPFIPIRTLEDIKHHLQSLGL
ncbi:MAG: tRNA (adenosine(37)-N6)-dimethylallyltransferase MiaA [Hydrogenobaculum sp.]